MPLIMKNGVPYSGNDSRTITIEEYNALPESLKNCGITYYIPNVTPDGLPIPTTADNGKLLGISSGDYALVSAPAGLPSVTSADRGKVLMVDSNGDWTVGIASGGDSISQYNVVNRMVISSTIVAEEE